MKYNQSSNNNLDICRTEPQKSDVKIYEDYCELSIFSKGTLTKPTVAQSIANVKKSFPTLETGFYEVLSQRVTELGFTDERLQAAVKNVIDTCIYPQPTIAQFISYDRNMKLFTYQQMLKMLNDNENVFKSYSSVRIFADQVQPLYASNNDIVRYGLERWNK